MSLPVPPVLPVPSHIYLLNILKIFQKQSQECNKYFPPSPHKYFLVKSTVTTSSPVSSLLSLLTILLGSDWQAGRGGSLASPGLGRHPDVVESVGVEVLQDVLRGVRVLDGLVVGELLNMQGSSQ